MGKRSEYEKRANDAYMTPKKAIVPVVPWLPEETFTFAEPCAGDGWFVEHVESLTDGRATCTLMTDIEPQSENVKLRDAEDITAEDLVDSDIILTNPPWTRTPASGYLLHRLIKHFAKLKPTWLLFDADWLMNVKSAPVMEEFLVEVVPIGRVKWMPNSPSAGKDNCMWALFDWNARLLNPVPHLNPRGTVRKGVTDQLITLNRRFGR